VTSSSTSSSAAPVVFHTAPQLAPHEAVARAQPAVPSDQPVLALTRVPEHERAPGPTPGWPAYRGESLSVRDIGTLPLDIVLSFIEAPELAAAVAHEPELSTPEGREIMRLHQAVEGAVQRQDAAWQRIEQARDAMHTALDVGVDWRCMALGAGAVLGLGAGGVAYGVAASLDPGPAAGTLAVAHVSITLGGLATLTGALRCLGASISHHRAVRELAAAGQARDAAQAQLQLEQAALASGEARLRRVDLPAEPPADCYDQSAHERLLGSESKGE
jgi:hypothetical protein